MFVIKSYRAIMMITVILIASLFIVLVLAPKVTHAQKCAGPPEKCRRTERSESAPHCYLNDEREFESSCDEVTNLEPSAPNCYQLTSNGGPPTSITYDAVLVTCPWGDTTGAALFVDPNLDGGRFDCNGIGIAIDVNCIPGASNPILGYLGGIINFLAGTVGFVVTAMLGVAGFQYITAQGNPGQLEAAKKKLINVLIAWVTFIFMYALLQWLVPGGIF